MTSGASITGNSAALEFRGYRVFYPSAPSLARNWPTTHRTGIFPRLRFANPIRQAASARMCRPLRLPFPKRHPAGPPDPRPRSPRVRPQATCPCLQFPPLPQPLTRRHATRSMTDHTTSIVTVHRKPGLRLVLLFQQDRDNKAAAYGGEVYPPATACSPPPDAHQQPQRAQRVPLRFNRSVTTAFRRPPSPRLRQETST